MHHDPQIIAAGFARRLALFYSAICLAVGVQLPFFPLWLEAKGLDARAIGFVLAVPMVVRIFSIPLATRLSDRRQAPREAIVVASALAAVGIAAVGLAEGNLAILVAFSLSSIAFTPIMPLAEAYALRGLAFYGRAYGPVRLWGSAAFIAGSLGTGWIIDSIAPRNLIWLLVVATFATAAAAVTLAPLSLKIPAPDGADAPPKKIWQTPGFLAVLAAAGLIQASHAVYYGFSTLDWRAAGLDGTTVGGLWALGVVAEITLFAISGRLPAVLSPTALLVIGGVGATIRWIAMALDPATMALPFLQCLHGLSFGATHLGAVGFVARAAPAGFAATGQGYLAVGLGCFMAAAMGMSGILYEALGAQAYSGMALIAAAGTLIALAAWRLVPKP
jgi:PPP family 3-phenylpropionic acid transporter